MSPRHSKHDGSRQKHKTGPIFRSVAGLSPAQKLSQSQSSEVRLVEAQAEEPLASALQAGQEPTGAEQANGPQADIAQSDIAQEDTAQFALSPYGEALPEESHAAAASAGLGDQVAVAAAGVRDQPETASETFAIEEVWPTGFRLDANTAGQLKRLKDTTTVQRGNKSVPLPPDQMKLGDDYEVLSLLGQGGMGFVYKVKDKRKNQIVAVKVVRPELATDERALKRFEQEAEAAMGLIHPNLVPVYAQGVTADGAPYLVMEYQEGTTLDKVLRQEVGIQADRAVDIFMQICDALAHAHAKGIVHRDLKPSNVVLTKTKGNKDQVRLVDFGIAKVLASPESRETFEVTHTGDLFGSPSYMSPEQCMGYKLDARSDVYSLGCVMYEVLSGQPPFVSDNPVQTIVKHLSEIPLRLVGASSSVTEVPAALEALVLRCLEKDPRNRYQSMEQLRKDLSNIQTGERPVFYSPAHESKGTPLPLLIKIAVIAVIDLICVSVAFDQQEQSLQALADANKIISTSNSITDLFNDAAADLHGYYQSKSQAFVDRYNGALSQLLVEITRLSSFDPTNRLYQGNVYKAQDAIMGGIKTMAASKLIIDNNILFERVQDQIDNSGQQQGQEQGTQQGAQHTQKQQIKQQLTQQQQLKQLAQQLLQQQLQQQQEQQTPPNIYGGAPFPLDNEISTSRTQIHDSLTQATKPAWQIMRSDLARTSRIWLEFEVFALLALNIFLVLGLGKGIGTQSKKRIWQNNKDY